MVRIFAFHFVFVWWRLDDKSGGGDGDSVRVTGWRKANVAVFVLRFLRQMSLVFGYFDGEPHVGSVGR